MPSCCPLAASPSARQQAVPSTAAGVLMAGAARSEPLIRICRSTAASPAAPEIPRHMPPPPPATAPPEILIAHQLSELFCTAAGNSVQLSELLFHCCQACGTSSAAPLRICSRSATAQLHCLFQCRQPCRASSAAPYAASACGDGTTATPSLAARIAAHLSFFAPPPAVYTCSMQQHW